MRLVPSGPRAPYISVRDPRSAPLRLRFLRHPTGRISIGRIGLYLAVAIIAMPVVIAAIYYLLIASPLFVSQSHFAVRSSIEGPTVDMDLMPTTSGTAGADGANPTKTSGMSKLGGMDSLGGSIGGSSSTSDQDPFVVASFLMSPEITRRLDENGWLRARFTKPGIDRWSRLPEDASAEELFAYWRRHVSAAVDRRSNILQLRVSAFSAEDARDIATRALAASEKMISDLTMRQRDDTLAVARAELAGAEANYEKVGIKIRQMRRDSRIVDPVGEVTAASKTLLRLILERIKAKADLESLKNLGNSKAPRVTEIEATIAALDAQIAEANNRLTGNTGSQTVLSSIADLERVELERRFSEGMLNVTAVVYDQARREAQHKSSFLLVFLKPTLPSEATEPKPLVMIAFVAALAAIAWLFALTAISITLDQLD